MKNRTVPFFKPSFTTEEEEAVCRVLRSGWLTTAKEALDFEKEFADFVGAKHALAVNSATSGLLLSMHAAGITAGTKILTSPYTFISTATTALHLGGGIVYADIEPDSYNISPEQIEEKLKRDPQIKAIVPIHIAGNVCNMREINRLAKQYGVAVIEDAAHSFPSKTAQGYAGTLGTLGVFSFYATKTITTGEGGMVCTNDDALAKRISVLRSHGINRTIWDRYTDSKASWVYDVSDLGWKCNLPDILAAIGRVQLRKAESFFQKRKAIAEQFNKAFSQYDFLQTPPDGDGNAWHLYLLRLVPEKISVTREAFAQALQEKGLGISVHFIPHFEFTYIKEQLGVQAKDFPQAAAKYANTITLPFWPDMSDENIAYVIDTVIQTGKEFAR